MAADPGDSPW